MEREGPSEKTFLGMTSPRVPPVTMATGYHSGLWQPLEKEKPQQRQAQAPPPPLPRTLMGRGTEQSWLVLPDHIETICPLLPDTL